MWKQNKDQLFWFLKDTQDFEVAVSGATRVKRGASAPLAKSLWKFNLKIRAFKRTLDLTWCKGESEGAKQFIYLFEVTSEF